MKIIKHTVPSLTYTLQVEGEIIDQTDKENPLTYLAGLGSMIPGFEQQLEGLEKGDKYDFSVQPGEGYGEINKDAVVDIPKDAFKVDGKIKEDILFVGNVVTMQDNQGHPMEALVVEVGKETVKMDFNHELAGKVLNFSGEILDVRSATEAEISHGHVHDPDGHHH